MLPAPEPIWFSWPTAATDPQQNQAAKTNQSVIINLLYAGVETSFWAFCCGGHAFINALLCQVRLHFLFLALRTWIIAFNQQWIGLAIYNKTQRKSIHTIIRCSVTVNVIGFISCWTSLKSSSVTAADWIMTANRVNIIRVSSAMEMPTAAHKKQAN